MKEALSRARWRLHNISTPGRRHVRLDGTVVLTYDDGPEPSSTQAVLSALSDHGATATFFVLVNRARREPGLLREVVDAGHEIALHGPDHRPLADFSLDEVSRRTADAKDELEDLLGQGIRWFRPPYGLQTRAMGRRIRHVGLSSVLWSSDWRDWEDVSHETRMTAARRGLRGGRIVLAHDGFAEAADGVDDGPRPFFDRGQLSRDVLAMYADRGLRAVSLGSASQQP